MLTRIHLPSAIVILAIVILGNLVGSTAAQTPGPSNIEGPGPNLPQSQQDKILLNDVETNPLETTDNKREIHFDQETKFASPASRVIGLYEPSGNPHTAESMATAALDFRDSLNQEQRNVAVHRMSSRERQAWTNLPSRKNAGGIRLGLLNEQQIQKACDMLAAVLSTAGYEKMRLIMLADDQLLSPGRQRPGFGTDYFSIVIFGEPSAAKPWALQLDGHHVGLNVAVSGSDITIAPSFIGTQPVTFTMDGKKIDPLGDEIKTAFALVNSLTDQQFRTALVGQQRAQIRTGPGKDGFIPTPQGVKCSEFNEQQRALLVSLIACWVDNLPPQQAEKRMGQLETEIDQMQFSWSGRRAPGSDASFAIQGPSIIIEFAYQDLGRDPLQHLHTQYRNPKNDYGGSAKPAAAKTQ